MWTYDKQQLRSLSIISRGGKDMNWVQTGSERDPIPECSRPSRQSLIFTSDCWEEIPKCTKISSQHLRENKKLHLFSLPFHFSMRWFRSHNEQSWDRDEGAPGCGACPLSPCAPRVARGQHLYAISGLSFYSNQHSRDCKEAPILPFSSLDLSLNWNGGLAPFCNLWIDKSDEMTILRLQSDTKLWWCKGRKAPAPRLLTAI